MGHMNPRRRMCSPTICIFYSDERSIQSSSAETRFSRLCKKLFYLGEYKGAYEVHNIASFACFIKRNP